MQECTNNFGKVAIIVLKLLFFPNTFEAIQFIFRKNHLRKEFHRDTSFLSPQNCQGEDPSALSSCVRSEVVSALLSSSPSCSPPQFRRLLPSLPPCRGEEDRAQSEVALNASAFAMSEAHRKCRLKVKKTLFGFFKNVFFSFQLFSEPFFVSSIFLG